MSDLQYIQILNSKRDYNTRYNMYFTYVTFAFKTQFFDQFNAFERNYSLLSPQAREHISRFYNNGFTEVLMYLRRIGRIRPRDKVLIRLNVEGS